MADKQELKKQIDDKITFLFDHWTMEDKAPYTFGGWREEIVMDIVDLIHQAQEEAREEGYTSGFKKGMSTAVVILNEYEVDEIPGLVDYLCSKDKSLNKKNEGA